MKDPSSKKTIIGEVGVATIGVEQHTFRTTVFGFEWARHHWKTQTNHHWQHTWGTKFPKNKINWGVGWGRVGLSNTLFVLLCSGVSGSDTILKPEQTSIGNTNAGPNVREVKLIGVSGGDGAS